MSSTDSRPSPHRGWPWFVLPLCAVLLTALGQAVAALSILRLGPHAGAARSPLPVWAFGAAWTLLYPCIAVASAHLWRSGTPAGARAGAATLAVLLAWMPLACAAQSAWVPVLLDLAGWLAVESTARVYGTASRSAGRWMWPVRLWMPCTTALSTLAALRA